MNCHRIAKEAIKYYANESLKTYFNKKSISNNYFLKNNP